VIPSPRPLVDVTLKPLVRDGVVCSAHARLEQAEEAVNRLGVNVALDVELGRVADSAVCIALLTQSVVGLVLVG
jgi:hypothetical protein